MKYSLTKQVDKKALVELFLNLSDSFDEDIPDIVWEGSEFEVTIKQKKVKTDINYISTKKGGEFTIKISWITPAAKKAKVEESKKKTKAKIEKGQAVAKSAKAKATPQPLELVSDEALWIEEESWEVEDDDIDWDSEDFDDEW